MRKLFHKRYGFPKGPQHWNNFVKKSKQCGLGDVTRHNSQRRFSFAKFQRPECTRLHLRELQSQKFSRRSMHPKLLRKVRRSQSKGDIAPILPLYTISLGPLYQKILRLPLNIVAILLQIIIILFQHCCRKDV